MPVPAWELPWSARARRCSAAGGGSFQGGPSPTAATAAVTSPGRPFGTGRGRTPHGPRPYRRQRPPAQGVRRRLPSVVRSAGPPGAAQRRPLAVGESPSRPVPSPSGSRDRLRVGDRPGESPRPPRRSPALSGPCRCQPGSSHGLRAQGGVPQRAEVHSRAAPHPRPQLRPRPLPDVPSGLGEVERPTAPAPTDGSALRRSRARRRVPSAVRFAGPPGAAKRRPLAVGESPSRPVPSPSGSRDRPAPRSGVL